MQPQCRISLKYVRCHDLFDDNPYMSLWKLREVVSALEVEEVDNLEEPKLSYLVSWRPK